MSSFNTLKLFALIFLSVAFLPGASGCGGDEGTVDPSICTSDNTCAAGFSCVDNQCVEDQIVDPGTLGQNCGGIVGAMCDAGQFCDMSAQQACGLDLEGVCQTVEMCTQEVDPVCGCYGTTYSNDCARRQAGAIRAFTGQCVAREGQECSINGTACDDGLICAGQLMFNGETEEHLNSCTDYPTGTCETPGSPMCDMEPFPVCGCDGVTYGNTCMRQAAQIPLAYTGGCQ